LDIPSHMIHSWSRQACTEMVMPMSYSEDKSMFPPYRFDYVSYAEDCVKNFGVKPRPLWISTEFGGHVSYSYVWKLQGYHP
jgi:lysosomal Pro-X carboxypeptidase